MACALERRRCTAILGQGRGGRQELESRHPHVFLGLGRPPGVCNREFWFFIKYYFSTKYS